MTRLAIPAELPIAAQAERIAELIRHHQVVVVAGETGSGKTTQLPKICLMAGRERIAHTQPRRLAARTVAERIATECETRLGDFVGYQVRFTKAAGRTTRIKLMTDGILLNELVHDRQLRRYDTVIIDEAHERSLNIDFLLGYLKQLLPERPELRVIVTSATIDTQRFSQHFDDAPIVEVSGRTYPVEVRYREPAENEDEIDQVAAAVGEIVREFPTGDILVFLSGEREIRDAADAIDQLKISGLETTPLFARLSAGDQSRVFQPHRSRRVVLATNVAETSVTVPGIRFVVDAGNARISRYSARTKVTRLPIEPVSQASANQRAGRCGRVGPGVAIRLYSEEDYLSRPKFTDPEILRTNLATVILLMAQAGLGEIDRFPFVEAPNTTHINDGIRVLNELGALRPRRGGEPISLTGIGRKLARMPVDPRLGRILLEAGRRGCLKEVLVIVAGLTIADVRERPLEHQQRADELHRRFWSDEETQGAPDGGDFTVLLRIWRYLRAKRSELSGNSFRRLCREEFLHYVRYREWEELVSQLREVAGELDLDTRSSGSTPDVLRSLLAGLLGNIGTQLSAKAPAKGRRRPITEYQGTRGTRFSIQPGSMLAGSPPPTLVAFELVETTRLWARTVSEVSPEWVEQVAGNLVTRTLSEPRFDTDSGTVVASEKVSLYGVVLIAGRRVNYGRSNPDQAREIFIQTGLVEGELARNRLVDANARTLRQAGKLVDRMRRPELLISDEELFRLYAERLPNDVLSGATLDKWLRETPKDRWPLLTVDDCISADDVRADDFPERFAAGSAQLPVSYVFAPGRSDDGASVRIKLEQLTGLAGNEFSWLVPGLRQELATELIRSLPKQLRTNFVPAPDFARRALDELARRGELGVGSFPAALGSALTRLTGVVVGDEWRPDRLPPHLRFQFVVTDRGREVARGEDLGELQTRLSNKVAQRLTRSSGGLRATGQRSWTFPTLPRSTNLGAGVQGYPALIDEGDCVGSGVLESAARAERSHAQGIARLLVCTNPDPTRWVVAHLTRDEKLALGDCPYPSVPALLNDAWLKASAQLSEELGPAADVRDEAAYARLAAAVRQDAAERTQRVVRVAAKALGHATATRLVLPSVAAEVAADIKRQLDNLLFDKFISCTPDPWFAHLPRYLEAARMRALAAHQDPRRDARLREEVDAIEDEYDDLLSRQPEGALSEEVEEIAFLIEEFRVSVFAQRLRTAQSVSAKRIRKAMALVGG